MASHFHLPEPPEPDENKGKDITFVSVEPTADDREWLARLEAEETGRAMQHPLDGPVILRWRS